METSCISASVIEEDDDDEEDKEYEDDLEHISLYDYQSMSQKPYERLVAWQESFQLCLWIYRIPKNFPSEEKFALISQMRRSAQSVAMNIAEGNAKRSSKEKGHFFETAIASLDELHCQCRIAPGLSYIDQNTFDQADDHIQRASYLINKLRSAILS